MPKESNVKSFHQSLRDNGYICTESFADSIYCALRKKPMSITMLIGQAGTGKSFLPETLGNVLGCNVYVKQAYQGMDWDEFVRKHVPDENTKSGIKSIDAELLRAVQESKDKQVILLLDEWDKTRISSDSYFLDFLQTGRISVSGQKYQANLDNLIIFFTSNNERDISEPLLRRVKVIEVEHLPVSLVANVLKERYKDNPKANNLIESVLKLYDTSIRSSMDKPATIQELCDIINDWLTYIDEGKQPDWQELVYINITKNERNHLALQQQISEDLEGKSNDSDTFNKKLDTDYFNKPVTIDDKDEVQVGFMPKMMELRSFDVSFDTHDGGDDDVFVDIRRDEESYTTAFLETVNNGIDINVPHFIGWNKITDDKVQRTKPYNLSEIINEYQKFKRMINSDGVVVFIEPFVDKDDILNFIDHSSASVRKATDDEIIFRWFGTGLRNNRMESNVRWVNKKGCEFIVPTQLLEKLHRNIESVGWYCGDFYQPFGVITNYVNEGEMNDDFNVHLRRLGSTNDYLNITVKGFRTKTDDYQPHKDLVHSGEAVITETKRTTTYDLGYATVRTWHRKGSPNYRADITMKDMPTNGNGQSAGVRFISSILDTRNVTLPLFISVDRTHFDRCDRNKYDAMYSSRILCNKNHNSYDLYAINCYDRTTFMLKPKKDGVKDLSSMFTFADKLREIRDNTLEVLC